MNRAPCPTGPKRSRDQKSSSKPGAGPLQRDSRPPKPVSIPGAVALVDVIVSRSPLPLVAWLTIRQPDCGRVFSRNCSPSGRVRATQTLADVGDGPGFDTSRLV